MYVRFPLTSLTLYPDFLYGISQFSGDPFGNGLLVILTLVGMTLPLCAIAHGIRFSPKGLRFIYANAIYTIIVNVFSIVVVAPSVVLIGESSSDILSYVCNTIVAVMELIYFYKRRSLFIHNDNSIRIKYEYGPRARQNFNEQKTFNEAEGNIEIIRSEHNN